MYRRHIGLAIGRAVGPCLILVDGNRTMPALPAALGAMATLTTWMLGPAKGLGVAAQRGNLPPVFAHRNRKGVPAQALIIQSLLDSAVALLILFVPSINTSYWIFSALTATSFAIR
jgi:amino acid transporter